MSDNLLSCENDREKKGCWRDRIDWRRAVVEALQMERRDGIFGKCGFATSPVLIVSGVELGLGNPSDCGGGIANLLELLVVIDCGIPRCRSEEMLVGVSVSPGSDIP